MESFLARPDLITATIAFLIGLFTFLGTYFKTASDKIKDIKTDTDNLYKKIDEINVHLKSIAESLKILTAVPQNLENISEYAESISGDVHDLLVVTNTLRK